MNDISLITQRNERIDVDWDFGMRLSPNTDLLEYVGNDNEKDREHIKNR